MGSPQVIEGAPAAAVIGGGFIGPVHVEALRRIGVEVVGLLGSSPDRAAGSGPAAGDPAGLFAISTSSWTMSGSGSSTSPRPTLTTSSRPVACWSRAAT